MVCIYGKKQTKLPVELVSRAIYHRITIMRQSRIESHHIPTILPIFHIPIIFPSYSIRVLNLPICLMGWIWLNHVESHFDTAHSPCKKSFEEGAEATPRVDGIYRFTESLSDAMSFLDLRSWDVVRCQGFREKLRPPPCKIQNSWDLLIFVTGFDQRL